MEQGQGLFFDFSILETLQSAKDMAQLLIVLTYKEQRVFIKSVSQKFLTDLYNYLDNQTHSPKTKFLTLIVLKEVIIKNDIKIIGLISSSQTLMQFLQTIALKIDPKKPMNEKGKSMFPQDKQNYGNKIMQIILQMLVYLGNKYPKTGNREPGNREPTRFKKVLMRLESENITLPQQNIYFPKLKLASANDIKKDGKKQVEEKTQTPKPKAQNGPKQQLNFQSLVRFVKFKVEEYMDNLQQQIQQIQKVELLIRKSHEIFVGQIKKFDDLGDSIFQSENNQATLDLYFKIRQFLENEKNFFQKYITKGQFGDYYSSIKISYQQIFEVNTNGNTKKAQTKKSIQSNQNKDKQIKNNEGDLKKKGEDSKIQKIKSIPTNKAQNPPQVDKSKIEKRQSRQNTPQKIIQTLFSRLQQRSKSHNGFQALRKSLQKEKDIIHAHPPSRRKQNNSVALNLQRSLIRPSNIFSSPPNMQPPYRAYQGQLVFPNKQLQSMLYDIKYEQGYRRFKIANFRNKYPIFENQHLQIGFKSEAIFQQFDDFNVFLSIQLYFGNKSQKKIRQLQLTFQGSENCLIYTSPKEIMSFVDAETQIKHGIMIVPLNIPFGIISMRISYVWGQGIVRTSVALPSSITQFSTYVQIQKAQFGSYWSQLTNIYRTDQFKLSHYFPPNSIKKYIPNVGQLTNYTQFCQGGNIKDYEIYCLVDIYENVSAAIKIYIRPNLNVVIQIGSISPSNQGVKYMKYYLQTLQMLLQETDA